MELIFYILFLFLIPLITYLFFNWNKSPVFKLVFEVSAFIVVFLLLLEAVLNIYFKMDNAYWIFDLQKNTNVELFDTHPYTVVSNKKNIDREFSKVHIKHNSLGYRGDAIEQGKVIVAAIGGSTTYGVGVDNKDTWPAMLNEMFASDTAVVNMGVPGHSTVEHLVTVSLYLDKIRPKIILLHTGLNDMRVSNIQDLKSDYSNYHAPHLFGSMGHCYLESLPNLASLYYAVRLMQGLGYYPICSFHSNKAVASVNKGLDTKALDLYRLNLRKLIHMCKYYTPNVIVVPQVLVQEKIDGDGLKWWIPFLKKTELIEVLAAYNNVSREVARSADCIYLDSVDEWSWKSEEFSDPSHFNAEGNKVLSSMIYKDIIAINDSLSH